MNKLIALFIFAALSASGAFTEFYVQTTGNNLNSGHTSDDAATFSATGGCFTNNTSASVCTFFKSGLNPVAGGVTNGAWASIYPGATTTNAVYVGLVTAADDTADTITVSLTAKSGTVPATDEMSATSIKVGGAWAGPNTNFNPSIPFPFNFVQNTLTNASGQVPFVNFKAATYSTTNAITAGNAGPIFFGGYTTTVRDGGRFTLDGTYAGTMFTVLTLSGVNLNLRDCIVDHNGVTAATCYQVLLSGEECAAFRVTARNAGRAGIKIATGGSCSLVSCEAYNCNTNNAGNVWGIEDTVGYCLFLDCISYSNTTANAGGIRLNTSSRAINCISYANGKNGFDIGSSSDSTMLNCASYGNGGAGLDVIASSAAMAR